MEILKRMLPLAALVFAGCEFTRDPVAVDLRGDELMVHGVLAAGSDTVAVVLTRVRPGTGGSPAAVVPVSGADVRVSAGGASVRLAEAPAGFSGCFSTPNQGVRPIGPGCYAAVFPGGIRSGTTYSLTVEAPGGGTIHGTATVPAAPVLRSPDENTRFSVKRQHDRTAIGGVPARWTAGEEAGGIALGLRTTAVFSGGQRVSGAACFIDYDRNSVVSPGVDSAAVVLRNPIACQGMPGAPYDSIHARLQVTAYDTAIARYAGLVGEHDPVQRDRLAAGVTGALGLFAGVATAERPVTLVAVD